MPCVASLHSVTTPSFRGTSDYIASADLQAAVNVAVSLERPLLVRGEPGTGKTLLAEAVAEALGMRLITWPVKSTTRAQDGLYVYDTVQRLYDSQFGEGDPADVGKYIRLGQLGEAFAAPERVVEHRWSAGDVGLWDNRRLLHRAQPWDFSEPRVMTHSRLAGNQETEGAPLGAPLGA